MMDKHTPGPWRIDPASNYLIIAADEGDWEDFWSVAAVGGDCGPGKSRSDANAHLIAAAPDLLAALEAMRDHPTIAAVCPSPLWAQMVNAILKARGETA
jgi:hypothetical protein